MAWNVYDSVLTSTYCRTFDDELANAETFFFGRHSKHENLTMLSVFPFNLNMVRKFGRKSVGPTKQRPNGDDHMSKIVII